MKLGVEAFIKDDLNFFEYGKAWKFDDPPSPPQDLIWDEFRKLLNVGNPPQIQSISLKHLKFLKNHFKTNLFLSPGRTSMFDVSYG